MTKYLQYKALAEIRGLLFKGLRECYRFNDISRSHYYPSCHGPDFDGIDVLTNMVYQLSTLQLGVLNGHLMEIIERDYKPIEEGEVCDPNRDKLKALPHQLRESLLKTYNKWERDEELEEATKAENARLCSKSV